MADLQHQELIPSDHSDQCTPSSNDDDAETVRCGGGTFAASFENAEAKSVKVVDLALANRDDAPTAMSREHAKLRDAVGLFYVAMAVVEAGCGYSMKQFAIEIITDSLKYFVEQSSYLYDWYSGFIIDATLAFADTEIGLRTMVDIYFQLLYKHTCARSILRSRIRTLMETEQREREEVENYEFILLQVLANHWKAVRNATKKGTLDSALLLNEFFEEQGDFLRWFGGFEYINRVAIVCRRRRVAVMTTRKGVGHLLPPELLEMVTNQVCDGKRVGKLLAKVDEEQKLVKDSLQEGHWMERTLKELGI